MNMRTQSHPVLEFDRGQPVEFEFEGEKIKAYEGESIASALYASGITTLAWSSKLGRPRGFFCGVGKCSSCLMRVDGTPNVRTCIVPVSKGMRVERQSRGLGRIPDKPVRANFTPESLDVELAVIGGGPAGLAAAATATRLGVEAIIVDENFKPGGQLIKQSHKFFGSRENYAGVRGVEIGKTLLNDLKGLRGRWILGSSVLGDYVEGSTHRLLISSMIGGGAKTVRAKKVIVATGARENMLIFPNNDLPGVYGAGGIQTIMNVFGVKPGESALVVGAGNVGLIIAYQLLQAGMDVKAIVEAMPEVGGYFVHAAKVRRMGVPILLKHSIKKASGRGRVETAEIAELDEQWNPIEGTEQKLEVDTIVLAVGLTPSSEIPFQARCKMAHIPELGGSVALHGDDLETDVLGLYVAGDTSGIEEATTAILEGKIAGADVALRLGRVADDAERIKARAKRDIEDFRRGPFGERPKKGKEKIRSLMEEVS